MFQNSLKKLLVGTLTITMLMAGCSQTDSMPTLEKAESPSEVTASQNPAEETTTAVPVSSGNTGSILDTTDMFTDRDLNQIPDLTNAVTYTLADHADIQITEAGVYVLQGTATDATVYIEATKNDKIQLVLDGVSITNLDKPCIYVKKADKVFVTTVADSSLTVTDAFAEDDEKADAAIFSCDDLVLNGTARLTIRSEDVGVDTKDDLKVTGGSYVITAGTKTFEANDSIRIAGGSFDLTAGTDGFHAENEDDDSLGYVYIADGQFEIQAGDDAIHGTSAVQIDGGTFTIAAGEGIEGTYVQVNGGSLQINASDDGINAGKKSTAYDVTIEITGGEFTIVMAEGDTDAIDANGDLIISGGTLNITARSAFDYDKTGTYTGGTLIVNGEQITELPQVMGGGMHHGGMGGGKYPDGGNRRPDIEDRLVGDNMKKDMEKNRDEMRREKPQQSTNE